MRRGLLPERRTQLPVREEGLPERQARLPPREAGMSAREARLSPREAGMPARVGLSARAAALKRSSPLLRGVVEGYYGRPWSGDARRAVIRFMGAHGLDTFVYGPKNDPWHRDR